MSAPNQFRLLGQRRFLPFFGAQALGAFNDNVYRNVLLILITFGGSISTSMQPEVLTNLAGGLFILPYLLFSGLAGQLADRFDKSRVVQVVKATEILRRKITALHSTFALASEPVAELAGWPDGCIIWETARPYVYLRTTADKRVLMGGYDEPFRDPEARDRLIGEKTAALARRLRRMFPRIPLEIAGAWAGTFADTGDGLPFIGRHPERSNVWLALGYGGNGITFSAIAADVVRDGILGRANPDAELFGFARGVGERIA